MTRYFFGASHEEYPPEALVRHAMAAERAGFDGISATGARYHPALIAQAWMTLARMFPGRPFLGIGSGEALNEVPVGDDWPSTADQIARLDEALGYIRRLWDGETITEEALEQARKWKGAQPPDHFTDDWHRPQEMYEHGEAEVSDEEFADNIIALSDPGDIQERLRELEQLGGTVITLQSNSGAHAERAIELIGGEVLPSLRGARV